MTDRCEWCKAGEYRFNVKNACCRLKELCQLPREALVAYATALESDAERAELREDIKAERKRLREVRSGHSNNLRVEALVSIRGGKK